MDVQTRKIAWAAPKNVLAYHTTRVGGTSEEHYKSSNLSLDVGDNPKSVKKNRKSLKTQLHLPYDPIFMKQIHSATVRQVSKPTDNIVGDSCYTDIKGLPLAVLSADCLPLLLTNSQGTKVGVIHAGWRGLSSGIIENFIQKFYRDPKDIVVWVGPSISPENYIIREDVFNKLTNISTKCFAKTKVDGQWHLDLKCMARVILKNLGVKNIFLENICTYDNSNLYYSYRRSNHTGRIASLIWIDPNDSEV